MDESLMEKVRQLALSFEAAGCLAVKSAKKCDEAEEPGAADTATSETFYLAARKLRELVEH